MRTRFLDNLGLKLVSLGLAVFLWAVVVGEQKVEVAMNIPLEVKGLPSDLIMVNEPGDTLEVHVRGPKTLVNTLSAGEMGLEGLPKNFVEGDNLLDIRPEMIRVPRGIAVVGVNPRRIRVILDAIAQREVEVSPRIEGEPAKGFVVARVTSTPPHVRMAGPKKDLRRLTRVYTVPINLEGHTASFSTRAMLEPVGRQVRVLDDTPIIVAVEIGALKS